MSSRRHFLLLLTGALMPPPGRPGAQGDSLLEQSQRWLENAGLDDWELDPAFLDAVRSGNASRLVPVLQDMMKQLQGDYVLDLATLQEGAQAAVPLLAARPETRGYAAWLQARLDYFQVARVFRRPGDSGLPPVPPRSNPTPDQARRVWEQEIRAREQPSGAAGWVPRLKPLFRRTGTPQELVWLAEIESNFNPVARNPLGAVGLYQLMPRTAEGLGLRLKPSDERLNPEKNAGAAARYLRDLHREFKDWSLALAAYNAGPSRVKNTLRRRRASSFDAIAPSLPAETQMYVPKFEALLRRRERAELRSLRLPRAA